MNREILFRGKSIDTGKWVYGGIHFPFLDIVQIIHTQGINMSHVSQVDPSTVGQFTGLTDKNGTKIFEGDIRDFDGGLGQVIWIDAAFAVKSPGSEAVDLEHSSVFINSTLLTTIHDNPTT